MKKVVTFSISLLFLLTINVNSLKAQLITIPVPGGFPLVLNVPLEVENGPDFVFDLLDVVDDASAGLITQAYILLEPFMGLILPITVESLDGPYVVIDQNAANDGFQISGVIPDFNVGDGRRSYEVSTTIIENQLISAPLLELNLIISWGKD